MALSESPTTLSAAAGPIQSRASNTSDDRYDPFSCTYLDLRPLVYECTRSRPAELLVDLPAMRTVRLNNTAILGGWLVSRCPHEGTLVRIVLGVSKILTHAWLRAALLGKRTVPVWPASLNQNGFILRRPAGSSAWAAPPIGAPACELEPKTEDGPASLSARGRARIARHTG